MSPSKGWRFNDEWWASEWNTSREHIYIYIALSDIWESILPKRIVTLGLARYFYVKICVYVDINFIRVDILNSRDIVICGTRTENIISGMKGVEA